MKNNTQFLLLYSISFFLSVLVTFSIIPTVKAYTLSVNGDTFIDRLDMDANFGTNPALIVTDIVDKKSGERIVFLSFDTSILPYKEKLIINKAFLKLWVDKVHYKGLIDIYLIEKPWDENILTWKSADILGDRFTTFLIEQENEGNFLSVDITEVVEQWIKSPGKNFGIALVPSKISIAIDSKENSQTSHPAEIEIIHEGIPGSAGADGQDGVDGTNGNDGTNGTNGTNGNDGTNGTNGVDGQDGVDGKDGFDLTLELCELYSLTSQSIPAVCETLCGNGSQESWEDCDDGNTDDGDGCSSDCQLPVCGDGVIDLGEGEVCDDAGESAICNIDCTAVECGDFVLNISAGEACDDGNIVDGDGCQGDCLLPVCGDGIIDVGPGGEECDDGNTTSGDGCQSNCLLPFCGDGIRDAGEDCDDGNDIDADGCSNSCLTD